MKKIYAPWRAVYLNEDKSGDGCLFCEMAAGDNDEADRIIHRGGTCFVVVNAYPYSNGHVMVVCNRHVGHFHEMTEQERAEMMALVTRCEKAIDDLYSPGGINVGVNLGRSAGAGILDHLHTHLVPRWHGDTNFMTAVGETRVISEDLDETYRKFRSYFTGG